MSRAKSKYTVISIMDSTGQVLCDHVTAATGMAAFMAVAKEREGDSLSFVASIPGHLKDSEGTIFFPGDSFTVSSDDVLDDPHVFK